MVLVQNTGQLSLAVDETGDISMGVMQTLICTITLGMDDLLGSRTTDTCGFLGHMVENTEGRVKPRLNLLVKMWDVIGRSEAVFSGVKNLTLHLL